MDRKEQVKEILRNSVISWARPEKEEWIEAVATGICYLLEPKGEKPSILSDEEIFVAVYKTIPATKIKELGFKDFRIPHATEIAQAQLDADVEWCRTQIDRVQKHCIDVGEATIQNLFDVQEQKLQQARQEILEAIEGEINLLVGNEAVKDTKKAKGLSDQLQPLRQALDTLKSRIIKPKETTFQ